MENPGSLASSLKQWIDYYEDSTKALDFERQALIKMRPFFGDSLFCKRILEERDHLIYGDVPRGYYTTAGIAR